MLGIRHEIILNIKTKQNKKTGISMEYGNKHQKTRNTGTNDPGPGHTAQEKSRILTVHKNSLYKETNQRLSNIQSFLF